MAFLRLLLWVTIRNILHTTVPVIAENEEDEISEMTHKCSQAERSSCTQANNLTSVPQSRLQSPLHRWKGTEKMFMSGCLRYPGPSKQNTLAPDLALSSSSTNASGFLLASQLRQLEKLCHRPYITLRLTNSGYRPRGPGIYSSGCQTAGCDPRGPAGIRPSSLLIYLPCTG